MLEVWGAVRAMLEIMIDFKARLTPTELIVIQYLHMGLTNRAIGDRLKYSPSYISNVAANIARKLGISNQPEYQQRVLIALMYERNASHTIGTPGAHAPARHPGYA